jgi:hypothetical protein
VTHFSLEDVFAGGEADKLASVSGWRKLPHIKPEVAKLFEYPQQFAEDIFARIEHALRRRVSDGEANAAVQTGRLFILSGDDLQADSKVSLIPDLPVQYIRSSDKQIVAAHKADSYDQTHLLHSRLEGEFVLSYKTFYERGCQEKHLPTDRPPGHRNSHGSQPRLRRDDLLIQLYRDSIIHHNAVLSSETEKRHGGNDCRPQFYLSLEGYCFSRSCEGG